MTPRYFTQKRFITSTDYAENVRAGYNKNVYDICHRQEFLNPQPVQVVFVFKSVVPAAIILSGYFFY